jgi:hypothetical protein
MFGGISHQPANCGGVPCTPTEKEDSTIVEEVSGTVIGPGSGQVTSSFPEMNIITYIFSNKDGSDDN